MTCINVHGTLFVIALNWKQPKCPSTNQQPNKLWSVHTVKYFSAVKRNKVLMHATTWVRLETFCQSQKATYYMIPLYESPDQGNPQRQKVDQWLPRAGGVRDVSNVLSRVGLFATPWTVARQAPLSMGFSRQEYFSEQPFPSLRDLPDLGMEPRSPALLADSLLSEPPGKGGYKTLGV